MIFIDEKIDLDLPSLSQDSIDLILRISGWEDGSKFS